MIPLLKLHRRASRPEPSACHSDPAGAGEESRSEAQDKLRFVFFVLGVVFVFLAGAQPLAAQSSYIEGISEVVASADGSQVYTLSETYLTPDLAFYYGSYVEGYLYQNSGLVGAYYASEYPYLNDAIVEMDDLVSVGSAYELFSNHAVWAYWIFYQSGSDYYYNPDSLSFASGDVSGSTDFLPFESGPLYSYAELIYLGSTDAQMSAAPPSISGLSPSGAAVETSGTITVTGSNLLDLCTGNTTVSITGSGVTLTVSSVSLDGTQAVLNYSIAANASTGNQSLTLRTCFGTSNAATFQVGDPTPVITSVSPNNWPAGSQTSFVITGSGFGTNPTIQVTGTGVTCCSGVTVADTQISATATVASNAPSGIATITVTSTGYLGNGFISTGGSGGTTGSASAQVPIGPQGMAPTIVWGPDNGGGSDCGGPNIANTPSTPKAVVVGQQITFTACFSPGNGATITSEAWLPVTPPGTAVGGYSASTQGGCVVPFRSSACNTAPSTSSICGTANFCDFPAFYWADLGGNGKTFTITYTYTVNGSTATGSASLTFTVYAPTATGAGGAFFTATLGTLNIWPASLAFHGSLPYPGLELGNKNSNGMTFQVTATPPPSDAGAFQWVQLTGPNTRQYVTTPSAPPATEGPGLYNWYPYVTLEGYPNDTNDSPGIELGSNKVSAIGEGARTFTATMYLMWDPALPTGCSTASTTQDALGDIHPNIPSTCTASIPVPLGYVKWGFNGDAINTLQDQPSTNTTWLLQPCSAPAPATPAVQTSTSFPLWTLTVGNTP